MNFFPHASVQIPRRGNGLIDADKLSLASFWTDVEEQQEGLSSAIGCYIFSIRAGKGVLPWYVGMAEKQSFRKECFQSHKLVHYNNAVAKRRGTPLLTLIAKYNPNERLTTPNGKQHRDIQFLETMLISSCLARNAGLYNIKDTKFVREMILPGLLNPGPWKREASVKEFKMILGT